jgi:nucleoside-diphosphate-sugar epimerase
MRALVTGSEGFLGRHFVEYLRENGFVVVESDIRARKPIDCRSIFRDSNIRFDLVVHCAAVIPDLEAREENPMPVAGNLELDAAMFQFIMRTRPWRTVYFSSAAAYPIDLNLPQRGMTESDIDLDDIRQPDGIYGFVKLTGEIQAREANAQGVRVVVVRPQTGYGTDQSLSYPFPSFIEQARRVADPFRVWGSGKQIRDFVHVDDIIGCVMACIDKGYLGPINIGNGLPIDMGYFANLVIKAQWGYKPTIEFLTDKPEGSMARYADIEAMLEIYEPKVTLQEGIRRAIEHGI